MTSKRILMRKMKNIPSTLDSKMADAMAELEKEAPIGISEGLPSVSVGSKDNPKDVIMITFTESAPRITKGKDRFGKEKEYGWIKGILKCDHEGYDSKAKASTSLKEGDAVSMNLYRHANLRKWSEGIGDLKDRTFIIGTMAIIQTAKGNNAMDYRIKEVTE